MFGTIKKSFASVSFSTLIYFLLLSFLLRFPFFFTDVINWDESTFILTGQSLLDGNLPYTELWDLKPPFLPSAFALFIVFFGKSISSIRAAGAICVALTAGFTYLIGTTFKSHRVGLIGGTLSAISLSNIDDTFLATMSEHIALVPVMGALLILVKKIKLYRLFWVGLLLSSATMIRLNLAYTTLAVGIFVTFIPRKDKQSPMAYLQTVIARGSLYASGALLVILLTLAPYVITNRTLVWWKSVVLAPLDYSGSKYSAYQALNVHLKKITDLLLEWSIIPLDLPSQNIVTILICLGALFGILTSIIYWRRLNHWEQRSLIVIAIFFTSISFSILKGGQAHFHYLIQIMPFLSLFAALAYEPAFTSHHLRKTIPLALMITILMLSGTWKGYEEILSRAKASETLYHGPAYEIADYFREIDIGKKPIYMMTSHLTYWLLDQKPLTPSSTHPSNIAKEYLLKTSIGHGATVELALLEVLEKKPEFIVTKQDIRYLRNHDSARALLDQTLESNYKLVKEIQKIQIYKRVIS